MRRAAVAACRRVRESVKGRLAGVQRGWVHVKSTGTFPGKVPRIH